jgi:hypothetical protein
VHEIQISLDYPTLYVSMRRGEGACVEEKAMFEIAKASVYFVALSVVGESGRCGVAFRWCVSESRAGPVRGKRAHQPCVWPASIDPSSDALVRIKKKIPLS